MLGSSWTEVLVNEVIPWVGTECARFGDSRKEIRERLGSFSSFRRSPGESLIDHYSSIGLMLHFDEADRLDFIEATAASGLSFSGVQLLARPFGEVLADLRSRSVDFSLDGSGCVLDGYGIELYTPAPDELDIDVEGVALKSPVKSRGSSGASEISVDPPTGEDTLF
ncbi:hypothetical protein ABZ848_02465 [Streptomyces sp. NPDC047081]|uniref:hypothetical protein n=1 Tax=Streptomyces sp. NPDC047081 TaxID=3154706 RepID=UPI00340C4811